MEDAFIHAFIHSYTHAFRPARVRTPPPRLSLAVANASSSSADARARALASIAADVDAMHEYPVNVTDERGNARRFVVRFPYVAYENQMDFIERALTAMVRGESALLESPTGTGKTLCLLAASLAYARAAGNRKKRKFREDVRAMKEISSKPGRDAGEATRTRRREAATRPRRREQWRGSITWMKR